MRLLKSLHLSKTLGSNLSIFASETAAIKRFLTASCLRKDKLRHNYQLERDYYLNPENREEVVHNIKSRKLKEFVDALDKCSGEDEIHQVLEDNLENLPLRLDEKWQDYQPSEKENTEDFVVAEYDFSDESRKLKKAVNLGRTHGLLYTSRFDYLGHVGGSKAHVFLGDLARLHQAIIDWATDFLVKEHDFIPVTVPNLAFESVVRACGYSPRGQATQIYKLLGQDGDSVQESKTRDKPSSQDTNEDKTCLVATSEIPLAALHLGETFQQDQLPRKYCAVGRCYRAEVGRNKEDSGIYRVPYFSKLEMFALTTKDQSDYVLNEFVLIQKDLFTQLNLKFRLVDMPPYELGINASRKFDHEAWFPGLYRWGEISSASNCKDFQSRRLNIKYQSLNDDAKDNEPFKYDFVHTVNATAVALPRILSILLEYGQDADGIHIPVCLQPYMNGQETLKNMSNLFTSRTGK